MYTRSCAWNVTVALIDALLDEERYREAAVMAQQARDAAVSEILRRRYHGLYLFASARLEVKANAGSSKVIPV